MFRVGSPIWWFSAPYVAGLWLALTGCYSLQHRLRSPFLEAKGIFVPVFDNGTYETGVERFFTNALIRELQSRHNLVLESRAKAQYEFRGQIVRIDINPTALTDPAGFQGLQTYRRIPTEFGVNVTVRLTLTDIHSQRVLWAKDFGGFRRINAPTTRTYNAQAPSSLGIYSQSVWESTYPDIARDMMRDVYDEMVELF